MREQFERGREVATREEKEALWNRLEQRLSTIPPRTGRRIPPALAWGGAAAVILAVALLVQHPWRTAPAQDGQQAAVTHDAGARRAGETDTTVLEPRGAAAPPVVQEVGDLASRIPQHPARAAAPDSDGSSAAPDPRAASPQPHASASAETLLAVSTISDSTGVASHPPRADPDTLPVVLSPGRSIANTSGGLIAGKVCNAEGKPLPYVNVLIVGTAWGAMTNDGGVFQIRNVPPGRYTLKAMCIGFGAEDYVADVAGGRETWVDVGLEPMIVGTMDLVEITVAKERIQLKSTQTRRSHDARSGESLPVDEAADLIGLKAGVVVQGGQLHFRGGRAGETQCQVDGVAAGDPPVGAARTVPPQKPEPPQPPVVPWTGGTKLPNEEAYDAMFFQHYGVNPLIPTDEDSLSTFALDVDEASYTIARRYLSLGQLPPKDAVRLEEFVNFFDQHYAPPQSGVFAIHTDGAPSPFGAGYHLVRVGLKAREIDPADMPPCDLVFVIDESGSMAREDRLGLVKRALEVLLAHLRPEDRVGIVVFQTTAHVVLEPTPIAERETILSAILALGPGGSTNTEHGLTLGYEMARRTRRPGAISRIVLCADGVANEGVTAGEEILRRVRREADEGIALTTIGFGMGNFNDVLMERLADRGDGSYYYVDDLGEASRIFDRNLAGTLATVAREAKVQVTFDPRHVLRYRLLGFENRDVKDSDFRNDRVDAGEIGAGHEVTALYEVKLVPGSEHARIGSVRLRWAAPEHEGAGVPRVTEMEAPIRTEDFSGTFEGAPVRLRLDACVAEFAEILRGSYWAKESRIADLVPLANLLAVDLADDSAVVEFRDLVTNAAALDR